MVFGQEDQWYLEEDARRSLIAVIVVFVMLVLLVLILHVQEGVIE